jgi:hypothetical protein
VSGWGCVAKIKKAARKHHEKSVFLTSGFALGRFPPSLAERIQAAVPEWLISGFINPDARSTIFLHCRINFWAFAANCTIIDH